MIALSCFDLSGKVAVVTGGGSGIGRGIAQGLAEAGASVVIASRRRESCTDAASEIADATGARSLALALDVTDAASVDTFVDETTAELGSIDILVNNAGMIEEQLIFEMAEEQWDRMLDTNVKGAFLLSKKVAAGMANRARGGKIINVASIAAYVAWPKMSAYCASKAACLQLTKVMALEWARYDIQVNAILPGYFLTPMSRDFVTSDEGARAVKAMIPMRRVADPSEIKGLAVMLASSASSFITGGEFTIDGGQSCR
ncbi:MAG: glucose 1-dehydrogenase [Gammaproteobacteria bacterium]|nr:glucose 1-dehydrogenase [Gammaproteobacteria bacterium]MDH4255395.1 glucose 1-dehydrogenase [Gammaproteobacteria bacterium]MDH5311342.1 glucose 1-dehydrogenase [Gammaproteobacteria bacterium]